MDFVLAGFCARQELADQEHRAFKSVKVSSFYHLFREVGRAKADISDSNIIDILK